MRSNIRGRRLPRPSLHLARPLAPTDHHLSQHQTSLPAPTACFLRATTGRTLYIATPASARKTALKAQMAAWLVRSINWQARMGPVMAAADDEEQYSPLKAPIRSLPPRS